MAHRTMHNPCKDVDMSVVDEAVKATVTLLQRRERLLAEEPKLTLASPLTSVDEAIVRICNLLSVYYGFEPVTDLLVEKVKFEAQVLLDQSVTASLGMVVATVKKDPANGGRLNIGYCWPEHDEWRQRVQHIEELLLTAPTAAFHYAVESRC